jgi:hypothetical protein
LAPWSIARGITVSGITSSRSLSKGPEHDQNHEPKRQTYRKNVKAALQAHVTPPRFRDASEFVSLPSSKRGRDATERQTVLTRKKHFAAQGAFRF